MRKIALITLLVLLASLIVQRTYTPTHPGLSVWFLNVGQGASILVRTASNHFILYDGGPGSQVLTELGDILAPSQRHLDIIALSHPHADHIRGLIHVLERYKVSEVWSSGSKHTSGDFKQWEHVLSQQGILPRFLASPESVEVGTATAQILHPPKPVVGKEFSQTHDGTLSLKLTQDNRSVLLSGDLGESQERSIVASCVPPTCSLTSDVLQVTHHGSASGTTEAFLERSTPVIAVIPVGARNMFKHPRAEVLERLATVESAVWRTDTDGRVAIVLLPTNLIVSSTSGRSTTFPVLPQPAPT